MAWTYEPDEIPKRKHQWDRDEAGFLQVGPHEWGSAHGTSRLIKRSCYWMRGSLGPQSPGVVTIRSVFTLCTRASSIELRRLCRAAHTMGFPSFPGTFRAELVSCVSASFGERETMGASGK